ncbi:hypothetical protein T484DRAFT_1754508 [Baffinella frigidus]|nr:hypothetical protein T484DRAFT_1754508 [Cryptophyta sp. CCMP2293]
MPMSVAPPPASWKLELEADLRVHTWEYAAGENADGTAKTAIQHKTARIAIKRKETLRVIGLKEESARSPDEQCKFEKANRGRALRELKPPPSTWKPELAEEVRLHEWRYAAGQNPDGSDKLRNAHDQARNRITHVETVRAALLKPDDARTTEDVKTLQKKDDMLSSAVTRTADAKKRIDDIRNKSSRERTYEEHVMLKNADKVYEKGRVSARNHRLLPDVKERIDTQRALPENKAKLKIQREIPEVKARNKARAAEHAIIATKVKLDKAHAFIEENGVDIGEASLTDFDAFKYILELLDDTSSAVGRTIVDALGGLTLREAFWEGKSNSAMYALMSRGCATTGESKAEFIRFLLRNNTNTPILTNGDNGQHFKYTDEAFKGLGLVYCPIGAFDTYADVTTLESAFQLFFDFLEVGSQRLWKVSGVGHSSLVLRKCDLTYITRTDDKNLRFMFGITIMKNVAVVKRTADAQVTDAVVSITAGTRGTKCNVNQGPRRTPIMNESQKDARDAAYATLPPNFKDKAVSNKRKADAVDIGTQCETMRPRRLMTLDSLEQKLAVF